MCAGAWLNVDENLTERDSKKQMASSSESLTAWPRCPQRERAGHLVLGPGCAVERPFAQPGPDDHFHGHAGVYLLPAPDADPATRFVNEPLTYKKCAGCPKKVVASDATRMPGEWKPRRDAYWKHGRNQPVSPGPHPAGSYACPDCDPRAGAA